MRLGERIKLAEKWRESTLKYDLKMIVNIGGQNLTDILQLAEHAERIKVDAVMLYPDLSNKPQTEEDMVTFMKTVTSHMPNLPVFYYHNPTWTKISSKY